MSASAQCSVPVYIGEDPYKKIVKYIKKLKATAEIKCYLIQHAEWEPDEDIYAKQKYKNEYMTSVEYTYIDDYSRPIGKIWYPYSPIEIRRNYNGEKCYWPICSFDLQFYDTKSKTKSKIEYCSYKGDYESTIIKDSIYSNIPISNHNRRALKGSVWTRGF